MEDDNLNVSGSALDRLLSKITDLQASVQSLAIEQAANSEKIAQIQTGSFGSAIASGSAVASGSSGSSNPNQDINESPGTPVVTDTRDNNQADYTAIKDSVSKVVLPSGLVIGDSNISLKGEARGKVALIKKSAGYVQTVLKLLKNIGESGQVTESDVDNLYVCASAHVHMLQEENKLAVIEGTGVPKDCVQMFRFLAKNPSFTPHDTQALENATRISLAVNTVQSRDNHGRGGRRGGFHNNRGNRGNYQHNNGFNNRNNRGGHRDAYSDAVVGSANNP